MSDCPMAIRFFNLLFVMGYTHRRNIMPFQGCKKYSLALKGPNMPAQGKAL
jgi:hypothetical protein